MMKNMKITAEDKKNLAMPESVLEQENYPYGLCLHIDDEMFAKLDLKMIPKIGQEFMILAKAVVKEVRKEMNSELNKISMSLQITDMDVKPGKEEKSTESILYGED